MSGWVGVALDGTLAFYDHWRGYEHIGAPVPLMCTRVRAMLQVGKDVRIITHRVATPDLHDRALAKAVIERWCKKLFGRELPVTAMVDADMEELWHHRAIGICPNTGLIREAGENNVVRFG